MVKRVTTDDVLKQMDKKFRRERKISKEIHESSKEFVRSMCDSGLVDDVEPTGPAQVIHAECLGCHKEIDEEDIVCRTCPPGTLQRFRQI